MTAGQARHLLSLASGADAATIDRAYRVAVKAAHPDVGGDAERLRKVIEAHRLLKALGEVRINFTPATRPAAPQAKAPAAPPKPPPPKSMRLQISVNEALFGGERRIEVDGAGRLDVRLPAGLRAGESLRLAGAAPNGADVMLRINIAIEPGVQVRGEDLWLDLSAPPHELQDGARLEIDTPRGRRAFMAPRLTEVGGLARLKGEGLPARGRHGPGDLIVRITLDETPEESVSRRLLRRFSARWAA